MFDLALTFFLLFFFCHCGMWMVLQKEERKNWLEELNTQTQICNVSSATNTRRILFADLFHSHFIS